MTNIAFIPVIHAGHELADRTNIITSDLEPFRQIVETSRGGDCDPQSYILSRHVWYVESLQLACDLIRKGLGWGVVPRRRIDKDINAGALVHLPLETAGSDFSAPGHKLLDYIITM